MVISPVELNTCSYFSVPIFEQKSIQIGCIMLTHNLHGSYLQLKFYKKETCLTDNFKHATFYGLYMVFKSKMTQQQLNNYIVIEMYVTFSPANKITKKFNIAFFSWTNSHD